MALEIKPLTDRFGAEVTGVDVRAPLGADASNAIRRALAEHASRAQRDEGVEVTLERRMAGIRAELSLGHGRARDAHALGELPLGPAGSQPCFTECGSE